jgi:hypothetical protein
MADLIPDPAAQLRQQVYDFTRQAGDETAPAEPLTIYIGGDQQAANEAAAREAAIPQFTELPTPEEEYTPRPEVQPAKDYNANYYTLTQEDIVGNRNLKLLGAQAGDQVDPEDNMLVRRFSRDEDRVEDYYYIDEALAEREPEEMKRLGAEIGDVIVDGELVKTGNNDFVKQMAYAFDTTESFYEQASKLNRAIGVYDTGSVPDYPDFDTRRKAINRETERKLEQEYGRWFKPDEGVSAANVLGTIGGVLADPVTYVPGVGVAAARLGVKSLMAGEAALGGAYSVLQDLTSDEGKVDPAKAALFTAVGAASIGVPAVIGKGVKNVKDKGANKFVDTVEKEINEHVAAGGTVNGAVRTAVAKHGDKKIEKALQRTGRVFNTPTNPERAQRYLNDLIATDPLGAASKYTSVNKLFGSVRTELLKRAPTLARKLDKYDHAIGIKTESYLSRGKPSIDRLQKLSNSQQIHRYLLNEDLDSALKATPKDFHADIYKVLDLYNEIGKGLKKAGNKFEIKPVYMHRYVKDYDGLLNTIPAEQQSGIRKALNKYATDKNIAVDDIPLDVRDRIANQIIRGRLPDAGEAGLPQTKQRVLNITDSMMPYYGNMSEAFERYVRTSINNIEKAKMFGKHLDVDTDGEVNIGSSIGRMLDDLEEQGLLKGSAVTDVSKMLNARLGQGEKGMNASVGVIRDFGYAGTIANPVTAAIQLTDLAASGVVNGFRNTLLEAFKIPFKAARANLGGKETRLIRMVDMGLHDAGSEMADMTKTAKTLHKMFKWSGFSAIDQFSKESIANAAFRKNISKVKTPKGEAAFRKKWEQYYGADMDSLVDELKLLGNKKGKLLPSDVPDIVREHSLAELLELQPVTRSDQSLAWLNNPDARIFYMLKTWTLKQYDIMRRNVLQEWQKGNKVQAVKFGTYYMAMMAAATGSAEMAKDMMLGREVKPEDFDEKALAGLLGMFGFSQYSNDRYLMRGDIAGWVKNLLTPATPMFDSAGEFVMDVVKDEVEEPIKYTKPLPIFGRLMESWFGGGKERYNEQQD